MMDLRRNLRLKSRKTKSRNEFLDALTKINNELFETLIPNSF